MCDLFAGIMFRVYAFGVTVKTTYKKALNIFAADLAILIMHSRKQKFDFYA